jgi:hypothetical protein
MSGEVGMPDTGVQAAVAGRMRSVPEEIQTQAGELAARHVGMRIYIKRAESGDVLVGRLVSVQHRPSAQAQAGAPMDIYTEVGVRWWPDTYLQVPLHPTEPVTLLHI